MGAVQSTLKLNDAMSQPLMHISNALNMCISNFEKMQSTCNNSFNTATFSGAREELTKANSQLSMMDDNINKSASAQAKMKNEVSETTNGYSQLGSKIKTVVQGIAGMYAINKAKDFVIGNIEAYNESLQAETKLKTVMKQRMGATEAQTQSILKLTDAQQKIGVIEGDAATAGAQQMATFLNTSSSLKTLIPAMNNLAAQQKGVNATSQDMVGIGNLIGKVMQGQTSALTRVGITFDATQEKMLKHGNEQQRAAVLAQVITDNVGQMNQAIANTPEGKITQMSNDWGDMKEVIGQALYPSVMNLFNTIQANMPQISQVIQWAGDALAWVINVLSDVAYAAFNVYDTVYNNWPSIGPIVSGLITAFGVWQGVLVYVKIKTWAVKLAQDGLNASMLRNPIFWVCAGIGLAIGLFTNWAIKVNNFKVVWLTCVDKCSYYWDLFKYGIQVGGNFIFNCLDNLEIGWAKFSNGISNLMVDAKANVLKTMQDLVNGAISQVNSLLEALNSTGVVSFDLIEKATFGTEAKASAEAQKQANNQEMANNIRVYQAGIDARNNEAASAKKQLEADHKKRLEEINKASKVAKDKGPKTPKYNPPKYNPPKTSTANDANSKLKNIADNTKNINDNLSASKEDIKYIRDMAETEIINRYTTAKVDVHMTNNNQITKEADADAILGHMFNKVQDEMQSVAEGVF